ncbi:BLOC-3 complex member HPS1 isoform 1-T2 [Clarias gariepinus]|uniref:Hermansky-Pudlak syndrome 1 protein n=1 Tax=Clarias gariepinus TaxID=13013 RepID=UPI00234C17A1|nr:Hermansky-Pudlak syndrome 1 protein [Clarias gariepinus]
MKCFLIATESAEVLFYWTDQEFERNIKQQYGASQEESGRLPAFADSISTLFAPIIISCSTMIDQLRDSYTSFRTENGHIYALHLFEECLYIAVNGDGEENDEDLKRKIFVMKKFTEILFGMVTLSSSLLRKELRPPDTEQRNRVWKKLQRLLETYSRLQKQDQSFLVEAVERLIHPALCEQCIEFLERKLLQQMNSSTERAGEEVLHAFILVHTKLLAFYSSRNASTLSSSDLLALIVIVQNLYPSNLEQDETPSEEVDMSSVPDIFYTPEPSPSKRDSGHLSSDSPPVFQFVDPYIQLAEDSLQTLQLSVPDPMTPTRVFLEATFKEGFFPMMPHSMYCLPLWPGITLVLLTKIPNSQVAMSVYVLLEAFTKLEMRLNDGLEGTVALRGPHPIQELRTRVDKFIRMLASMDILTSQLKNTWADFKNKAFTRSGPGITKALMPLCRNIKTQLCSVYRQCFAAVCMGSNQRLANTLQERALNMVQEKLMDWKEFLLVKSKRNITMVSYLEEFPGLVHFIYVDRTAGQMIAPSLNVTESSASELGKGPIAHLIKNKLWGLVATTRHYLQKGYTTVTLRDGDFYFCYFLWFENETGYKLEVVDIPSLPDDSAPIGMLAWDYYRKLLRYYSKSHQNELVKCYELLTVHLGVVPTEYILQHCSQLARKLWEPSRIPLL